MAPSFLHWQPPCNSGCPETLLINLADRRRAHLVTSKWERSSAVATLQKPLSRPLAKGVLQGIAEMEVNEVMSGLSISNAAGRDVP